MKLIYITKSDGCIRTPSTKTAVPPGVAATEAGTTRGLADGEKLATKFVIDAGADNALVEFDGNVRD
jgi:hypothetical protein